MRKFMQSILTAAGLAATCSVGANVSGSDGSFGPISVDSGTQTIQLPPNGIINATTINVAAGATLTFDRNALNTPVHLLATGDISIAGMVSVQGELGTATGGGAGGPGGFDGGAPGRNGQAPGPGLGPGGGLGGLAIFGSAANDDRAGFGSYATIGTRATAKNGSVYGSPLMVPPVGGSGGGGHGPTGTIVGGGGGGGAILIASDTLVSITGLINARGPVTPASSAAGNSSGGGIRIVAPVVDGAGTLDVRGGGSPPQGQFGGDGRIRVDTIDLANVNFVFQPSTAVTLGSFLVGIPPNLPRLDIVNVAGNDIPVGTQNAVDFILPFGTPNDQTITVRATNFDGMVPIRIVISPQNGDPIVTDTEIDMGGNNVRDLLVPVDLPQNILVNINVYGRDA